MSSLPSRPKRAVVRVRPATTKPRSGLRRVRAAALDAETQAQDVWINMLQTVTKLELG